MERHCAMSIEPMACRSIGAERVPTRAGLPAEGRVCLWLMMVPSADGATVAAAAGTTVVVVVVVVVSAFVEGGDHHGTTTSDCALPCSVCSSRPCSCA